MKPRRIVVAMHGELVPPENAAELGVEAIDAYKMEYDVCTTLEAQGHDVARVGVEDELRPLRLAMKEHRPHVVFNLLMHFHDAGILDSAVVSWLELAKQPYTGCNPRGLLVANDKALCKKVLAYHRIRAPKFMTVPRGRQIQRLPKGLRFPLFVKSRSEHASTGIAQASIVRDLDALNDRVEFVHRNVGTSALCEEFIEGRELTVGILGNKRIEISPVFEVFFDKLPDGSPNIVSSRVKWDREYQLKIGLRTGPAELPEETIEAIQRTARRIHKALGLSGYTRIDMRMDGEGRVWILEANPNPDLCFGEDFAEAFERMGYSYAELLDKIVRLGIGYAAPWRG